MTYALYFFEDTDRDMDMDINIDINMNIGIIRNVVEKD
jgi:hypothetical protein